MNAVGIIAEYNPLHNGHVYHMQEARRLAGCDAVIVAMSGNYVQRGEPAILNKWERARLAVLNGADLVVEIPALYCLGNAFQYARGGVSILEAIPAVSRLAFGSECADINSLRVIAECLDENSAYVESAIKTFTVAGMTYPAARARVLKDILKCDIPEGANDILGVEYIRNCKRLEPVAIKRIGAAYNDPYLADEQFQSASAIRSSLMAGSLEYQKYVPDSVVEALSVNPMDTEKWMQILKYAVMNATEFEIDSCPSGDRGIGSRIKKAIACADTWSEFVLNVKSRNYTYTRISRLCMQIVLRINREEYSYEACPYIRVLAMNEKGRGILANMRKCDSAPLVITKLGREKPDIDPAALKILELDVKASDVYNLVAGYDLAGMSDYRMHPFVNK